MSQRPANFGINRDSPLAKGLVFAGLGNAFGRSTLFDSSWRGNHAALTNMDPATDWMWVPELGRWGVDFDNINDRALLPNQLWCGTQNGCAAWIKTAKTTGAMLAAGNAYDDGGYFLVFSAGKLYYSANGGYADSQDYYAPTGAWHHFAVSRYESSLDWYIDGTKFGNTRTLTANNAIGVWSIGAYAGGTFELNGTIADLVIWNRTPTVSEIKSCADPSNTLLEVGGRPLILPPRRRFLPAAAVAAYDTTIEMPAFSISL